MNAAGDLPLCSAEEIAREFAVVCRWVERRELRGEGFLLRESDRLGWQS